jgi:hypothetical protein
MGGGFGAKFGLGVEGQAACEVARELKRPVHLMLTREDEFLTAGNRSGAIVNVKAGARKDGTLTALSSEVQRLGGIGGGSFSGLPYVYKVHGDDGVHSSARSIHTHMDSSRAMRAPGHPQGSFIMEAVFWIGAYLLILRGSFKNKIHYMPVAAMCGNIAWEFILGLDLFPACPVYWQACPDFIMQPATLFAALLDAVILYTILRFGREQFSHPAVRKYFPAIVFGGVGLGFALIYTIMSEVLP